ncbi:MAG: DUF2804 family protein, partial [Acidobacteriota bacterium]|nr:DUF2804 family protein [Acidobacteriota bacterium]
MTTHERELTAPVDLAGADGLRPNPDGLGWSRRPLHRDNLAPFNGRNKRWDYWAILAGERLCSVTVADLDLFVLADVWWADLASGATGGQGVIVAPSDAPTFGAHPVVVEQGEFCLSLAEEAARTTLSARWSDEGAARGALEISVARPVDLESLNVVIPWNDELFNFTSKQWCRPAEGSLECAAGSWTLGGSEPAW